jgi:hypothetical protein
MSDSAPKTTAELLARVDRAWQDLEATIGRLTPAQLADLRDPAGWAVKDHLMHVAAWEDALVARFGGRPIHEALGLDEAILAQDEDAQNAALFARHRHRPLAEVLLLARASHRALRARLAALSDDAVTGVVADLLPPGSGSDADPVVLSIAGNTWDHYDAHHSWIRALVDRR